VVQPIRYYKAWKTTFNLTRSIVVKSDGLETEPFMIILSHIGRILSRVPDVS